MDSHVALLIHDDDLVLTSDEGYLRLLLETRSVTATFEQSELWWTTLSNRKLAAELTAALGQSSAVIGRPSRYRS